MSEKSYLTEKEMLKVAFALKNENFESISALVDEYGYDELMYRYGNSLEKFTPWREDGD
jgi:hypothetical protein